MFVSAMAGTADIDYEVYRLLSKRITDSNQVEYLVRWKGFNSDWDSWEPAESLRENCLKKISNFESKEKLVTQNYAKKLVNRSKMVKKDPAAAVMVKRRGRPKEKGTDMQKKKRKRTENENVQQGNLSLDDVFETVLKESVERRKNSPKAGIRLKSSTENVENADTPKLHRGVGRPRKFKKVGQEKKLFAIKMNNNQRPKLLKLTRKKTENIGGPDQKQSTKSDSPKKQSPQGIVTSDSPKKQSTKGIVKSDSPKKQSIKDNVNSNSPTESSLKRKYTKKDKLFWQTRGSNTQNDSNVFITDDSGSATPDIHAVAPLAVNVESQEPKQSGALSPGEASAKRKYVKRNQSFWEKRSMGTSMASDTDTTPHIPKTQTVLSGESVQQRGSGNKVNVKYRFKMSKKNSQGTTTKSPLSLSENSKLIKHKRMFKSPTNQNKNQFQLSVSRLIGSPKLQGQSLKLKQSNSGKDGVKKRGRPPKQTVQIETDEASDDDNDDEILYSLANGPSVSNDGESVKARSKSDTVMTREKKSPESGRKKGKKHRSKSDGLDMARIRARISKKQKMRLLDSLKATAAGDNAPKPVRPVSPTPLYTTVKHSAATATVLPSSQPHQPPSPQQPVHWAPESDSPTEATQDVDQASLPLSPATMSYKVLLENLPQQLHPKKTSKKVASDEAEEDVERRVSVRATECAFKYKQILIKKNQKYTQIWLNTHTKMKNALNPMVIQEISAALSAAKYDDSNLVMLSGLGNVFCSGIDLHFLTSGDRRVAARQMGDALRDLIRKFTTFPKLIVAVVTGPAIGLGTAILPLCDIVYATDKASFYLPYGQLAQTPEGCSSYTLPQCCGTAMASEMLIGGRKITAIEACQLGLVSQVFWPTSMMQEVIPRVQHMALLSGKALETTKLLIRSHQRTKLDLTNESECNLLVERWPTPECQRAMQEFLCNEKNYML